MKTISYARPRQDEALSWEDLTLTNLEGIEIDWQPQKEWVKCICFDINLGVYVLTDDDDTYFVCHSIFLEFKDESEIQIENRV
jgi:hypothetical protein